MVLQFKGYHAQPSVTITSTLTIEQQTIWPYHVTFQKHESAFCCYSYQLILTRVQTEHGEKKHQKNMACGTFAQSHKDQCTSLAKVPQKFHCTVLCAIGWEQSQVNPWKGLHTTLLHIHYLHNWGVRRAWWLKRQTCDRKVASLNPSWIGRRIFFLRVKFLCWLLFSVGSTPVLLQRPQSFCQKCRWQVTPKQAYTRDPVKSEWADYATIQA